MQVDGSTLERLPTAQLCDTKDASGELTRIWGCFSFDHTFDDSKAWSSRVLDIASPPVWHAFGARYRGPLGHSYRPITQTILRNNQQQVSLLSHLHVGRVSLESKLNDLDDTSMSVDHFLTSHSMAIDDGDKSGPPQVCQTYILSLSSKQNTTKHTWVHHRLHNFMVSSHNDPHIFAVLSTFWSRRSFLNRTST